MLGLLERSEVGLHAVNSVVAKSSSVVAVVERWDFLRVREIFIGSFNFCWTLEVDPLTKKNARERAFFGKM